LAIGGTLLAIGGDEAMQSAEGIALQAKSRSNELTAIVRSSLGRHRQDLKKLFAAVGDAGGYRYDTTTAL
jgi:hypothetical protein